MQCEKCKYYDYIQELLKSIPKECNYSIINDGSYVSDVAKAKVKLDGFKAKGLIQNFECIHYKVKV